MDPSSTSTEATLQRRVRQQQAVADFGRRALGCDDLEALFRDATQTVATTLEMDTCAVLEFVSGDSQFLLRAGHGWSEEHDGRTTIPVDSDTQLGYTLEAATPVVVDDLRTDERVTRSALLREVDAVSGLSVVIGPDEEPWGVLGAYTTSKREFDEGETAFVESVGNVLASAIERDRVSRRRDAEAMLKDKLVDTSPIGITIVDSDGVMQFANDRAEAIFGRSRERINELRFDDPEWDEIGPDGEPLERKELPFPRIVESEAPLFDQVSGVLCPDGERVWISVNGAPLYDDRGDIDGVVFAIEDITAQFLRDRALERYETIVETVYDGIYVLDDERRFELVNDAFAELTGFSREELRGQHASVVFGDAFESTESSQLEAADGTQSSTFEETILTDTNGTERLTIENRFTIHQTASGTKRFGIIRDITERKQLESALRAERNLKDRILETSPVGITLIDADGMNVFANDRAEELFGRSLEELRTYVHDDDRWNLIDEDGESLSGAELPFTTVKETGEPVYDEVLGIDQPDGTRVWLSAHCSPLFDADGTFDGAVYALRDITEQKRLESELEQTLNRVTDAFNAIDTDWNFTYVNERASELLNAEDRELVGKNVWEEYPSAAGSTFERQYRQAMETQETVTFEEYSPVADAWLEVAVYPSETGLSVYFRDISERKARERRLKQFERIVETVNDGVYVTDGEGTFVFVNDAFVSMAEQTRQELLGSHGSVFFGDRFVDTDEAEWHELVAGERDSVEFETAVTGPGSETHTVQNKFVPLEMDGETGRVGVTRDITDRKARERALEESNERLEQFAYAASHDLQEPLRMVSSYLQLIDRRYTDELDEDGQEFIEFAVDGAERMREMIDGLLEFSRVETRGEPLEPVELDDVLADVRRDLAVQIEEHDAEITAEPLPCVEGDGNQLRQVFQNILSNAIEYAGDDPPRIDVSAHRAGSKWAISVSDEGIGIDPDDTDRIFGLFNRLHAAGEHDGSGIGLALCKRIIERHGGRIWVDSVPGDGATFSFTLLAEGETEANTPR
ncbi:PAS domain S-box protein [Natronorubrum bangense]|uniref:histidine kinase n=2 Tax=Natronorubrum bangense TaxID=61858 RepID=L9WCL1_9EURY|nr:PAS domain S-box protein [Natronorubrum bangense]ELY47092.1 multi-sensor signal transduction histidine kinase [Natronorubrum bangense JCM 10635]QCC53465.1 PAS domain S-box protein [Natronorubrum bangense]